ncbi:MAG TPA: methyltransferase domain-containing protein [Solirubrobacteraceae bacterium]|nr:methyltransferase domain-containing protein [Solirubrobacteraceae bacterium]
MNRERWARVARGWEQRADPYRRLTMPVTMWMIEAIAPQPGHTILDLAAGIGDTGFLASELIQPGGTLITTDYLPEMLSAAQRRAETLGVKNVRFKQVDASQPLDFEAASIDGVLCRWGYMLMGDGEAALQETRRILRPGGRVALAAWMSAEENQWSSLPVRVLIERGALPPPENGGPGQFAWAEEGVVAERLENAGFVDYEVQALDFPMRFGSVQEWWTNSRAMGVLVNEARIDDEAALMNDLAAAVAQWTADDGSIAIPARTWVAAATG